MAAGPVFITMADYRPVLCSFWTDPDTEEWKANERLVYLFLCTNKEVGESGIYQLSQKYISERTNISIDKIKEIIITLSSTYNKITYDNNTYFVHGFMKRNFKGNPALLEKSIIKDFEKSPSIPCWTRFCEIYKNHFMSNKIKGIINSFQSVSKHLNDNDNEYDNRNDNESLIQEGMQGEKPPGPEKPQSKIIPPKREWVKKYCEDRENGIDPDSFFDHYETRGWIPKGATKQMKDWQAAIRTWEKFKKENGNNKADETRWKFLEGK